MTLHRELNGATKAALPFSKPHERSFRTATPLPSQNFPLAWANFWRNVLVHRVEDGRVSNPVGREIFGERANGKFRWVDRDSAPWRAWRLDVQSE
jgi:hypothetical protein